MSTYAVYLLGNSDVNEALKIKSSVYHRFAPCFGLSGSTTLADFLRTKTDLETFQDPSKQRAVIRGLGRQNTVICA